MPRWINHVAISAPRNGTTSHAVTPSSGTVATGTLFTPTAGNFLLVVVEGAVTSTTPSGWTLPTGGSAVSNTGLYVWHRTAAGSDILTTTHNGSNYPIVFDFYEFPAGTTFLGAASATGVAGNPGGAGPTLTLAAGTKDIFGAAAMGAPNSARTWTWNTGVKATDTTVVNSGTDGYSFTTTYLESSTLTSASAAATISVASATVERLMFAVSVPSGGTTYTGTLSASLPLTTAAVSGVVTGPTYTGTLTGTLAKVTGSISGTSAGPVYTGTVAGTTPAVAGAISGSVTAPTYTGTVAAFTPKVTGAVSGTTTGPTYSGTLTANLPPTRATIAGTVTTPAGAGTLSATLPRVTGSISGTVTAPTYSGTLNSQLARLTAAVTGVAAGPSYVGTVSGILPRVTGTASGAVTTPTVVGTLAATLPRVQASTSGTVIGDPDYVPPRLTAGTPHPDPLAAGMGLASPLTVGPPRTRYSAGEPLD